MIDSTYRQQLRGRIASFDPRARSGVIAGSDGLHYSFFAEAWRETVPPAPGMEVDFVASDGRATSVHLLSGAPGGGYGYGDRSTGLRAYPKSRVTAAVLAFFLGEFGVHKFYLGYIGEGFAMLAMYLVSWVLVIVIIGIFGVIALHVIVIIEFVIYLSKSDEEFHQMYVVGRKPWF